ncbi:uncharacterized protein [Aristolochia californica]|uniref:uncharacterized protein n=1 Tax=Aristolochia californica TaxID=171875 RepID=UPI0035DCCAB7
MSGVSLAVAPRTEPDQPISPSKSAEKTTTTAAGLGGVIGSLRVIELQLVAFIMVFSASGLVPILDLGFPVLASVYLLLLARFTFPTRVCSSTSTSQQIFRGNRFFRFYVVLGTTFGLFLPLAYVLGGFARGDEHAIRSATPHLFLLSCQILTENVISGLSLFSPPVRALVPLLYTVRRIFVVIDWVIDVWLNKKLPANAQIQDVAWSWFGKVLAVANLAYFSINLFVFLIPKFLPRAFEQYFNQRDNEVASKMAEDKRPSAATPPSSESAKNEAKKSD